MHTQLITLKANPGSEKAFLDRVRHWANGPGKRLKGCDKLQVLECKGDPTKLALIIHFADKDALERFSADAETLAMFKDAKPLVEKYFDSMETTLSEHELT